MALIELKIPAGFRQTGTDLQSEGRWRDGNLVRWSEGSLGPVGGWTERMSAPYASAPRGMIAWEDTSNSRWIAAGTYNKLYASTSGGTTYDITPAGLTAGSEDAAVNTGYGGGSYGTEYYGQARPDTGNYGEATTWSVDTWGQYLVACSVDDGKLYEWQLNTGTAAAQITNAPVDNLGLVVTEDRFMFALGAGGDPRKIAWCDFEDNTSWTAASTNQAGDHTLQTSGRIMAGIRAQGQTLILTDVDAHRAIYSGPPFVYQFERVGDACGLISRKAVANTSAGAFWMGQQGFFLFDGGSVQQLPCEVHDAVFGNINSAQVSKTWAVSNGQNGEVWFFYVSEDATEIDSYVAFDYREGHWMLGKLDRTSGVDRGVFRTPIWSAPDGDVFDHETGFNHNGASIYIESGPFKIGAGDNIASVTKLIPDEASLGDVQATFKTRFHPTDADASHGPYTASQPTDVRFQGRQVRMRLEAQQNASWRVGNFRADVKTRGRR